MRPVDAIRFAAAKSPLVVGVSLVVAVAGARSSAPRWPFYVLAAALAVTAVLVWVPRGAWRLMKTKEQLGFTRNRDLLWFEMMAEGLPGLYYVLAIACFVAALLTGMRFPYLGVVIAAALLNIGWGEDRRRYPADAAPPDER